MTLFLLGLIVVMGAFIAALFLRGSNPPPVGMPAPEPAPPPVSVPVAAAPAKPAPEMVKIRWISEKGHVYGETKMFKVARRPQMKHIVGKSREAVFLASHREANGIWIYREVK